MRAAMASNRTMILEDVARYDGNTRNQTLGICGEASELVQCLGEALRFMMRCAFPVD